MKTIVSIVFLLLLAAAPDLLAQEIHFMDTIKAYNHDRIVINAKGSLALAGWGIANMAGSGIGLYTAQNEDWHYFHLGNMMWGLSDATIGGAGIIWARKQSQQRPDAKTAYHRYQKDKRTFLIALCSDVVVTGVGAGMVSYSNNKTNSPVWLKGIGRALVFQGIVHLAFDNIMFRAHMKYNSRWAQLLNELQFTGNGIGFNYTFPTRHINYSE